MNKWIKIQQESYLQAIIDWDSPHEVDQYGLCLKTLALWRCTDYLENHALCQDCCWKGHKDLPFHQVEFWTGTHYEWDWLYNLGVIIHLDHHGSPCLLWEPVTLVGELQPHVKDWNIYDSPSGLADTPQDCTLGTVADINRIHKVWIWKCSCMDGCENINTWSSDCIRKAILRLKLCLPLISFKIVIWTIWSTRHLCITYGQNWRGWHAHFSIMAFRQVMSHPCKKCTSLIKDQNYTESASGIVSRSPAIEKFKTTKMERTTIWSGIMLHRQLPHFVLCHMSSAGCESTGGLAARSRWGHLHSNVCYGQKL